MCNKSAHAERRRFSRIPFTISARFFDDDNELMTVDVLDISLKGLLISKPQTWSAQAGKTFNAILNLAESDVEIRMALSAAHVDEDKIGFLCDHIDLDSISHLKRLVELNVGDDELLHRELSALLD